LNQEVWQQLLSLESMEIVRKWYKTIHGRSLNECRTKEINAAARQAREYFRNANNSNFSVRPLLTFYGVTSLSRALLLLLGTNGGEANLTGAHGLKTVEWKNVLCGKSSVRLDLLDELKIETCGGLFYDFVKGTDNRISIHVRSEGVDWWLSYGTPELGEQFSFADILARIPDLEKDYINISSEVKYAVVNDMTYKPEVGFQVKVHKARFDTFKDAYTTLGYAVSCDDNWCDVVCDTETINRSKPLFMHTYIQKQFNAIPVLHIVEPFPRSSNYSQLCITYITSYFLGMLVRYYPTQWMSLIQGDKEDALWPTLNRAQNFVENSYPDLVIELIYDVLKTGK
jgi:hypothetical protein